MSSIVVSPIGSRQSIAGFLRSTEIAWAAAFPTAASSSSVPIRPASRLTTQPVAGDPPCVPPHGGPCRRDEGERQGQPAENVGRPVPSEVQYPHGDQEDDAPGGGSQ